MAEYEYEWKCWQITENKLKTDGKFRHNCIFSHDFYEHNFSLLLLITWALSSINGVIKFPFITNFITILFFNKDFCSNITPCFSILQCDIFNEVIVLDLLIASVMWIIPSCPRGFKERFKSFKSILKAQKQSKAQ